MSNFWTPISIGLPTMDNEYLCTAKMANPRLKCDPFMVLLDFKVKQQQFSLPQYEVMAWMDKPPIYKDCIDGRHVKQILIDELCTPKNYDNAEKKYNHDQADAISGFCYALEHSIVNANPNLMKTSDKMDQFKAELKGLDCNTVSETMTKATPYEPYTSPQMKKNLNLLTKATMLANKCWYKSGLNLALDSMADIIKNIEAPLKIEDIESYSIENMYITFSGIKNSAKNVRYYTTVYENFGKVTVVFFDNNTNERITLERNLYGNTWQAYKNNPIMKESF